MLAGTANFDSGVVGSCFAFDGSGRVRAASLNLPVGSSDRTLELWVNMHSEIAMEAFFAGYGSFGNFGQSFALGASGRRLFFSQWGLAIFGPDLTLGEWHHVAVTNSGFSVSLFLDGVLVGMQNLTLNTSPGTDFFIGSFGDALRR